MSQNRINEFKIINKNLNNNKIKFKDNNKKWK